MTPLPDKQRIESVTFSANVSAPRGQRVSQSGKLSTRKQFRPPASGARIFCGPDEGYQAFLLLPKRLDRSPHRTEALQCRRPHSTSEQESFLLGSVRFLRRAQNRLSLFGFRQGGPSSPLRGQIR